MCTSFRRASVFRRVRGVALRGLLLGLIAITGSAPLAAEPLSKGTVMPQTFRIDDLSIRLSRQVGNVPWQLQLSGVDGGSLVQAGKQRPFPYSAKDLVELLNALYEVHFFEMPSRYAPHTAAQLMADGMVSMVGVDSTNSTGTGVCVGVASFENVSAGVTALRLNWVASPSTPSPRPSV
ncbi:hypothetical protein ACVBEH_16370 [Roseateles sp. GG27B]